MFRIEQCGGMRALVPDTAAQRCAARGVKSVSCWLLAGAGADLTLTPAQAGGHWVPGPGDNGVTSPSSSVS